MLRSFSGVKEDHDRNAKEKEPPDSGEGDSGCSVTWRPGQEQGGGGRGQQGQPQPGIQGQQWLMETLNLTVMNLSVTFTGTVSVDHGGQKSDFKSLETQLEETESRDASSMKFDYKIGKWDSG